MTIDIDAYSVNKKFVVDYFNTKGNKHIGNSVSMMASVTFVPAIVCAYWIAEETGWQRDAIDYIQRLKDFYGYTRIDNKPPGAPI